MTVGGITGFIRIRLPRLDENSDFVLDEPVQVPANISRAADLNPFHNAFPEIERIAPSVFMLLVPVVDLVNSSDDPLGCQVFCKGLVGKLEGLNAFRGLPGAAEIEGGE
ncbi:hypothetical protein [Longimonas halophila]|uniref:hypothetical protein n=1 Tax=Longimonas halophila TaxID=1469170 RepID=UPI001FE9C499|nr:hypothetical protein [Longimonas halophila]